jgi:6,7-dimethyl-8-ribityllumazine synthase
MARKKPAAARTNTAGRPRSQAVQMIPRVAIITSQYNQTVTAALLAGAMRRGAEAGNNIRIELFDAAGAFEVVPLATTAALSGRFDGVVGLGCIIKGETRHDEFLAHAVTSGLANISISTGVATALGILTVETGEQALERAGLDGKGNVVHERLGNKGYEAMDALLSTLVTNASILGTEDVDDLAESLGVHRDRATIDKLVRDGAKPRSVKGGK